MDKKPNLTQQPLTKAIGQSRAYLHLKLVAEKLARDFNNVTDNGYSEQTINDVRASCIRAWQDAVRYVTSSDGLNERAGSIRAAKRRLREKKGLLSFLTDEAEIREKFSSIAGGKK